MAKISDRQMAAFKKLGYSDEQIEEMIEDDKAVDRNEPLPWDMSKEEHKKAMKYANADEHKKPTEKKTPTVYNWDTTDKPKKQNSRSFCKEPSSSADRVARCFCIVF